MPYPKKSNKICVVGLWHLGCVLSSCLAEAGYKVVGTDFNKEDIDNLAKGVPPLYEPGLKELIGRNLRKGNLSFTDRPEAAIKDSDFIFLAFDTPVNKDNSPNLSLLYRACRQIAKHASKQFTLVVLSQVPVGTCDSMKSFIRRLNPNLRFAIIYNPENLMLGQAIDKFVRPDRVIIGTEGAEEAQKIEKLYHFIKAPKIVMDLKSAEMLKHAINSYLASSISFINEVADLCEVNGADVRNVIIGMKSDKRIGRYAFLGPGLGFGGVTLGRDVRVLRDLGVRAGVKTYLLDAVARVNSNRKQVILNKIKNIYPTSKKLNVGMLGISYKPGTNVFKKSIAVELGNAIAGSGAVVKVFDPVVKKNTVDLKSFKVTSTPYQAAKNADLLILATEWPEFKKLDFKKIKKAMKKPVIIDSKNFLDPVSLKKEGFVYYGIGLKI